MKIKSLKQLREVDKRTLHFQPLGLGGKMRPEDAARFQQEVIGRLDLDPEVPDRVRDCYERLRTIYTYGVLCYDFFTVAHDQARLALEFILRQRFAEFYGETASFRDNEGHIHQIPTASWEDLRARIQAQQRRRDGGWQLVIRRTDRSLPFDGMLYSLLRWARDEGLLRGQGNRWLEQLFRNARNYVAHGAGDHLLMPGNAELAISDVREVINQLWGAATPGGRLYPSPLRREVHLVGWSLTGDVMAGQVIESEGVGESLPAAEQVPVKLPGDGEPEAWTWVLVLAVPNDEGLMHYDSLFEVTTYPSRMLWGPGTVEAAMAWLEAARPLPDEVEVLDRLFLLQHVDDRVYLPRCAEIAASLMEGERGGTWYLVRSDSPNQAFNHVRQLVAGVPGCSRESHCRRCPVETVKAGTWEQVIAELDCASISETNVALMDARVPSGIRWPRYNLIVGDGSWTVPADA